MLFEIVQKKATGSKVKMEIDLQSVAIN